MSRKILSNKIRCNFCGEEIESTHVHDFKSCFCGRVAVDGGKKYLKRSFTTSRDDFTDLSIFEQDVNPKEWLNGAPD